VSDRLRGVAEPIADLVLRGTGGLRLARWLDSRDTASLRVLLYHRVVDPANDPLAGDPSIISATPEAFDEQIRVVARNYDPVSLEDVVSMLTGSGTLPRRAVLVTFDDGYRDVITHAWPILRRYGVPAVVFIPTAFPGHQRRFWWDEVWQMLSRPGPRRLVLPTGEVIDRTTPETFIATHRRLTRRLRREPPTVVRTTLEVLREALGEPTGPWPVPGWEDFKQLAGEGLTLASHGRTHASLPALTDADLADEIEGAGADLKAYVGTVPPVFAYPFGLFDSRVAASLRARGYTGAFCTTPGRNALPIPDTFAVRRQSVNVMYSSGRVQLGLAGFYPGPWSRLKAIAGRAGTGRILGIGYSW
jgi:peptidoglycan/xylan/chitin deacetylase (PgdA/CDA1 family)